MGAELIMKLVISEGDLAMPVRQLLYVESNCMGGTSSLLVFGGQVLDQPDTLALVSLDSVEEVGGRDRSVHRALSYTRSGGTA